MEISFPTDTDGFLTQECPSCQQYFKVVFGEGSTEPISHCPYCGFEGHDCWWTQAQADYISTVAESVILGPELNKLERSLKNLSSNFLKIDVKSSTPKVAPPPMDVDGDFKVFRFSCCSGTIKVEQRETLFCVICGKEMDLRMSESKKVFLSHKGVDKNFVIEFKETLKLLGYEPWIDEDAMPAGTPLVRGLLQGMQDSCGVVFFITPSFQDEGFLETEVNYAIQEKHKKKDKFAIIALQFVDDNGNVGDIPQLLETYVWKKPKTPLHALREIVRALPVQVGAVDWREEIEGVVQMPRVKSKSAELSHEAKIILLEAAAGDGTIMHLKHFGGESIQTNQKQLIPENNPEIIALWVGGLEDLERRRFIKRGGLRDAVYDVTREGYEAAKGIRKFDGAMKS